MAGLMFAALVAELRMLSSGESFTMVTNPTITKSEHHISCDTEPLVSRLLEPGVLFNEVYPESLLSALIRLVFSQLTAETEIYRWKSLGYWFCYQLMSALRPSDIFHQTAALRTLVDMSTTFLDSFHKVSQRYY